MNKKLVFVMMAVMLCVLVFAGCESSAGVEAGLSSEQPEATQTAAPTVTPTPTAAPPTATQVQEAIAAKAGDSTLTVSATEIVKMMPDIAYVSIGVRTVGDTADAAQQENARIAGAFLAAVEKQGVAKEDIETQGINVYADYENPQKTVMENTYRVTIRKIDTVGAVIDAAIAAGANTTYSLEFDLADSDAAYMEALGNAVKNVEIKANAVAQAGGYEIVRPQAITENSAGYGAQPYVVGADAAVNESGAKTPTPVAPKELEISATVSGTYVIK
ncbi:MAG: SIMPL domain-containing protein [Christensenella sp.]